VTKLSVDVRNADDRVVVALSGELDMAEVPGLRQELDAVEADGPPVLVLDLRNLSFIDSSGLRCILESDVRARRDARQLRIVPGPEPVHRIFLIALLDKRLDFAGPEEAEPDGGVGAGPAGHTEGSA
jgi:anti-sigma B factor antagonist